MNLLANIAVTFVAALHVVFLVLEMFLWNTPSGRRIFRLDREFAGQSAPLAANQGLYNGFIAAGLVWSLILGPGGFGVQVFFLSCVVVAGVFGAVTVNRSIFWIQALPGAVALVIVILAGASV